MEEEKSSSQQWFYVGIKKGEVWSREEGAVSRRDGSKAEGSTEAGTQDQKGWGDMSPQVYADNFWVNVGRGLTFDGVPAGC